MHLFRSTAITCILKASKTFWFYIFNTYYNYDFAKKGQNILLHSLTSYKWKYIITSEAGIGSCSKNDFLEGENSLKLPQKNFF